MNSTGLSPHVSKVRIKEEDKSESEVSIKQEENDDSSDLWHTPTAIADEESAGSRNNRTSHPGSLPSSPCRNAAKAALSHLSQQFERSKSKIPESPKSTKKASDSYRPTEISRSDDEITPTSMNTKNGSELFTRWMASNGEGSQTASQLDHEEGIDLELKFFQVPGKSRNDLIKKDITAMDAMEGIAAEERSDSRNENWSEDETKATGVKREISKPTVQSFQNSTNYFPGADVRKRMKKHQTAENVPKSTSDNASTEPPQAFTQIEVTNQPNFETFPSTKAPTSRELTTRYQPAFGSVSSSLTQTSTEHASTHEPEDFEALYRQHINQTNDRTDHTLRKFIALTLTRAISKDLGHLTSALQGLIRQHTESTSIENNESSAEEVVEKSNVSRIKQARKLDNAAKLLDDEIVILVGRAEEIILWRIQSEIESIIKHTS